MDVSELISLLGEYRLLDDMPPEHVVFRRISECKGLNDSDIVRLPAQEGARAVRPDVDLMGRLLLIPDGDAQLPPTDQKRLSESVSSDGTDALAWYRSFHWSPNDRWGIYVLDEGLFHVAWVLSRSSLTGPTGNQYNTLDYLQLAMDLLFLHEYFHYVVDVGASLLEIASEPPQPLYAPYVKNVYMANGDAEEPIEEALANAFALNRLKGRKVRAAIGGFMDGQPKGYSTYKRYAERKRLAEGARRLGTCLCTGHRHRSGRVPLEMLFDVHQRYLSYRDVPVYIVRRVAQTQFALEFIQSIRQSELVESPAFARYLARLPNSTRLRFDKVKQVLATNARHPGLNLEKLRGWDTIFTVRIDRGCRASLRPEYIQGSRKYTLLRIGSHDEVYRRPY
jgi:hypothetical protein